MSEAGAGFRHDAAGTPASVWRDDPRWTAIVPFTGLDAADGVGGVGGIDTVVVLAAHPDDESLGAGGLVATAHDRGLTVRVVVATAGEHSHPHSPTHTPETLAVVRSEEARNAVAALSSGTVPDLLALPDGAVADHERTLVEHLVTLVGDGRRTLVVAPWRHDGHPDHEAAGRAAATAAQRTGARLVEHPIWWWHWSSPDAVTHGDWGRLRALALTDDAAARKQQAIAAHRSQVEALSDQPGDEVLLGPELLAHFAGPVELYVVPDGLADVHDEPVDTALDDLHVEHDDPWGVDHRWYEERKRALVLACLPRAAYARGVEVGCSTGAVTAALAERCTELVALDASPQAVARARTRLAGQTHVSVELARVPWTWPDGDVDLVVVSEVGYFLSPVALDALVERVRGCLATDGVVLLCHWRHPVKGWVLDGPDVHARFVEAGVRPVVASYVDRDVELLVLGGDGVLPEPGG